MFRSVFGVGVAFITSLSAYAADLSVPFSGGYKDGPYVDPAIWTGFYAGISGGYANGQWKGCLTNQGPCDDANFTRGKTLDADGGFGGGQIGYNKQYGAFVLGGEADIFGSSFSGKTTFISNNGVFDKTIDSKLDYFGTVRARLGYSMGTFLPYITGGLAWGHTNSDLTVVNVPFIGLFGGPSARGSADEDHIGWTIGAGGEWAISPSWSLKAEYLYIDLGTKNYSYLGTCVPAATCPGNVFNTDGFKSDLTLSTVKVGLNYHIGAVYEPLK
jgi:outer membrane immunogenic protein